MIYSTCSILSSNLLSVFLLILLGKCKIPPSILMWTDFTLLNLENLTIKHLNYIKFGINHFIKLHNFFNKLFKLRITTLLYVDLP